LEEAGYDVLSSANGEDALSILKKGPHPSIIILGQVKPLMSGEEFLNHLGSNGDLSSVPVIMLTNGPLSETAPGPFRIARNPIEGGFLLKKIESRLAK